MPACDATVTAAVWHPGVRMVGQSLIMMEACADGGGLRKRIPTVLAPFHAGTKFTLSDHPSNPGVSLHFTNVTLLLPNTTFAGIFESGFMDFFEMGHSSRLCFTTRYDNDAMCGSHAFLVNSGPVRD